MIFDRPEQQKMTLDLINEVVFSGKLLDALFAFKQEVLRAEIRPPQPPKKKRVPKPKPQETP